MATPIRFDIVSDVVCPWCAIGLAALETALDRVGDAAAPTIAFHPLELNPGLPREGEAVADNMARKYGAGPEQAKAAGARVRAAAAEVGVDLSGRPARLYDTFDAHRLLHWAGETGGQHALKKALLAAYFTRGENVSDPDVLVDAAARAGLDAEAARAVLAEGRYAGDVRAAEGYWRGEGVVSVPTILIDARYVVTGAQSPERLEKAIRKRLAESG
jgi:predicted DsbA family dithiol-disulfide isomerase